MSVATPVPAGNVSSLTAITDSPVGGSEVQSLTAVVGEQFCSDYTVHELPTDTGDSISETHSVSAVPSDVSSQLELSTSLMSSEVIQSDTEVVVNKALLAQVEVLEAENSQLKASLAAKQPEHFRIKQIQHNDKLFSFTQALFHMKSS